MSEGITDYYADLALVRGAIVDSAQFLDLTNAKMVANQDYYRKHGYVETHRDSFEPGRVGVWMAKTLAAE